MRVGDPPDTPSLPSPARDAFVASSHSCLLGLDVMGEDKNHIPEWEAMATFSNIDALGTCASDALRLSRETSANYFHFDVSWKTPNSLRERFHPIPPSARAGHPLLPSPAAYLSPRHRSFKIKGDTIPMQFLHQSNFDRIEASLEPSVFSLS